MQIGVESQRAVENKRVFVVETDEIIRAALQLMLHDENETHEIAGVEDTYRKAAQCKPDVILLGLALVREHGTGLLGQIRKRIPGVKIAVVADSATEPLAQQCLGSGAQSVIGKPFTVEGVRRKVDVLLGRRTALVIPVQIAREQA